jgi:transposase
VSKFIHDYVITDTLKEAAEMTGVSYRQMKRLKKRFEKDGDQGLVHQGRGKAGNRGHKEELKKGG